jgi:hypothetical protein
MPLIRYRTGDVTRVLPEPCPCGSPVLRLDRVRRRSGGLSAEALDEILFEDSGIVDCRYEIKDGVLTISALCCAEPDREAIRARVRALAPELEVSLDVRAAGPEDRTLYFGKRVVLG